MPVFREGVGAGHHEERAVHHAHDVKGPWVRVVKRVAGHNLPSDHEGEHQDEPRKSLANLRADFVDGE